MTQQMIGLSRAQGRTIASMGEAVAEGARILVVIADDERRTDAFFEAMLNLTNNGTQVTLTKTSDNDVSAALEARPDHGLVVVDAEHLSPVDQGYLSSMKAGGVLPITILITNREPGALMDREDEPGPWSVHFVTRTLFRSFRWPANSTSAAAATMTVHEHMQT